MMIHKRSKGGQFIILAAALILIIMVSVVTFLYTNIPTNQIVAQNVLGAVNSVEQAADKVLAASASYYSTILNVTGNYTYARQQATTLTFAGFNTLYNLYSYYGFTYSVTQPVFSAYWYSPISYTYARSTVHFNLTSLGFTGLNSNATQELLVRIVCPPNCPPKGDAAIVEVEAQGNSPLTNLEANNFYFESYNNRLNEWVKQYPTEFTNYGNGTYSLSYSGFQNAYILGVVDQRGILAIASSYSSITYTFNWPTYNPPITQPFVVQVYNNGTLSMLGQLLTQQQYPIPPVPVKDILVNETNTTSSNGGVTKPFQVPFQVEDWASDYTVPLGLAGNETLFSSFQMVAALVAPSKTKSLTVYWEGLDSWNQTPYAIPCTQQSRQYFTAKQSCTSGSTIMNGALSIDTSKLQGNQVQLLVSVGGKTFTVSFVRADGQTSMNNGGISYTLVPGVVRDIIQVEPENFAGFNNAYSVYFQLVLLIPADTNYIEVFQRAFFVNVPSNTQRNVNDLMLNSIQVNGGSIFIQNSPNSASQQWSEVQLGTQVFDQYNQTTQNKKQAIVGGQYHLWGMICSALASPQQQSSDPCSPSKGFTVGFIMAQSQLQSLYGFTNSVGQCGGGVLASASSTTNVLEIDPVLAPTCSQGIGFDGSYTISWWGALWFGYHSSMDAYLVSQLVENPPTVSVET
ncbi:hypothetical protein B9Q04_00255 [Candidatus Marsarchaeota G2 archaeon BE_D]|jgi:hypothetical protein|uniref:Uncharacterized protein n=4 Tax=Candidatus Marsarchaeota group 2 TaxID=2203771 RepID=A0A2R6CF61_9ARCH|nr:MAG: hypothetical protein B9Q04_00255 [Candidatus Marsarchaeota G2 archaeon BE_D]